MIRKLETGDFLLEDDAKKGAANNLQPRDYEAVARAEDNKKALFRKPR